MARSEAIPSSSRRVFGEILEELLRRRGAIGSSRHEGQAGVYMHFVRGLSGKPTKSDYEIVSGVLKGTRALSVARAASLLFAASFEDESDDDLLARAFLEIPGLQGEVSRLAKKVRKTERYLERRLKLTAWLAEIEKD